MWYGLTSPTTIPSIQSTNISAYCKDGTNTFWNSAVGTTNDIFPRFSHTIELHFPTIAAWQIEDKINKTVSNAKKEWKSKEKKHRDQSETKVRELSKLVVEVETKVEKENWDLKQVYLRENVKC